MLTAAVELATRPPFVEKFIHSDAPLEYLF